MPKPTRDGWSLAALLLGGLSFLLAGLLAFRGAGPAVPQPLLAGLVVLLGGALGTGAAALRRAREAARRAWAAPLEPFLRHAPDLVTVVEADGTIRYQSPSHERVLGHPAKQRIGQTGFDLVHPEDLPAARRFFEELLREPEGWRSMTVRVRHRDGSFRILETLASNLLHEPTIAGIVVNSRDVTERRQAEERQATQLAVARVLAEAPALKDAAPRLLEAICTCAGWDLGEIWVVDPAGNLLRWHGLWHVPSASLVEFETLSRETSFAPGQGLAGRVWESGRPAWCADVAGDEDFVRRAVAAREGLHGALAFPVWCGGQVGGVVAFFSRQEREPDQGLLAMMADIGFKIGAFVERKKAEEALRESEERSRAILETAADGIITIDERGVVESINSAATRIFGYEAREVVGRNLSMLMPAPYREEHDGYLARYLATGEAKIIGIGREVVGRRKDGTVVPLELAVSEVRLPGRRLFTGIVRDITERKQAEEALRESEERFRGLAEATFEGVAIHDGGIIIDANENAVALYGGPREEILGRKIIDFVAPEDQAYVVEQMALGRDTPYHCRFVRRDGSTFLAEVRGRPIHYQGRPARVAAVRDVTESERQEAALRESEGKYRLLMDEASDGLLILDPDGERVTYANAQACEVLGYDREEATKLGVRDLIPAEDLGANPIRFDELRAGRLTLTERRLRRKDGTLVPVEISAKMLADGRLQALVRDITERKRAEARDTTQFAVTRILTECSDLAEATPRLLEAICEGMGWDLGELWTTDDVGDRLSRRGSWYVSSLDAREFEGVSRDMTFEHGGGLPGRVWAAGEPAWVFDVTREEWFRRTAAAVRNHLHGAVGFPIRGASGVIGVMVFLSAHVRQPDEAVLRGMADIGRQIGHFIERKRAEGEASHLQRAVEHAAIEWRLTFDAMDSPVLIVDAGGLLVRLNRAAQEASGRSYEEILGRPIAHFGPAEPWTTASALTAAVVESRVPQAAHARDEASGRTWDVAATLLARAEVPDDRVILVARDVTRIVELQESLRRSETMSAMGSLVAGVAHEVRNPLFSISANIDAFEAQYGDRGENRDIVHVLRQEVERLSHLMQELLDYGRPVSLDLSEQALEDVIAQAVHACRPLADQARVRLANEVRRGTLPPVQMDRKRLVQVFQNLLENAIQHSRSRGMVRLTAQTVTRGDRVWVECVVEDSGPGFREEDLSMIFEPFFTRRRGGTGLGLSIVARIVEEHGGRLVAANRPEGGAAMTVLLARAGM